MDSTDKQGAKGPAASGRQPVSDEEFPAKRRGTWQRMYERLREQDEEAQDKFFGRSSRPKTD